MRFEFVGWCRSKKTTHWLIGAEDDKIMGCRLPSARQVLRYFLHQHFTYKKTVRESARAAVLETIHFWERANIPTSQVKHIIVKLEKLYNLWIRLKKSKIRTGVSNALEVRTKCFVECLDSLFDIAHQDAETMKIEEDIEFLKAQREKGRRGCMLIRDMKLAAKTARKQSHLACIIRRKEREEQRRVQQFQTSERNPDVDENEILIPSENTENCDSETDTEDEVKIKENRARGTGKVINTDFLQMLERGMISTRKAAAIMLTVLGEDAGCAIMNKSTLH